MKKIIAIILTITALSALAQPPRKGTMPKVSGVKVTYVTPKSSEPFFEVLTYGNISVCRPLSAKRPFTSVYINYDKNEMLSQSVVLDGSLISSIENFNYADYEIVERDVMIAGWQCLKYRTIINSNTIEIFATDNVGFYGTPTPNYGVVKGLVLKVVRNGNVVFEANYVDRLINRDNLWPESLGTVVSKEDFSHDVRMSVVKSVNVFKSARVGFNGAPAPMRLERENEVYSVAGGTVILKKVKLPKDVDSSAIFAKVVQYSDGDAYDRTGSVFVIPTEKKQSFVDAITNKGMKSLPHFSVGGEKYYGLVSTTQYDVPVELMRFFTPFGVRKFNHNKVKNQVWADSVVYKQEVTHVAKLLKDEAWIGLYIGNWDKNGHIVSLDLDYHPGYGKVKEKIVPLFNTVNLLEQAGQNYPLLFGKDSLNVNFDLKESLKNAVLVYTTTGHGGWTGGDEFNKKLNTVRLDGKIVFNFIPWREDCASYRNLNPASGNFANGLSSSDLSRSNWCPGTVTNPCYIPLGDLPSGRHNISVSIPQGEPDGNSISYWCVSGVLIGD